MSVVEKPHRLQSRSNKAFIGSLPCSICLRLPSQVHHLKSVGAGGGDDLWNLCNLCPEHHHEYHQTGHETFRKRHGDLIDSFRVKWKIVPLRW